MDEYLKEGEQTKITKTIKDKALAIEGNDFEFVIKTLAWINKNIKYPAPEGVTKNKVFRKRTADQIIKDCYATGCADFALVFVAIARAKGIPTKYVEVISKDYFNDNLDKVRGHVFAECLLKGNWYAIDPMGGNLKFNTRYSDYIVYAKGLDSWELGIFDINSMRVKFKFFAKEYNSIVR
ncbi:MAG: transglutaminase-like domain-containing protein [bacterium]